MELDSDLLGFGPLNLENRPHNPPEDDPNAIVCVAQMIGVNLAILSSVGHEQTGITFQLADRVGGYEGIDISGMTTSRISGVGANTFALLGHVSGDPRPLRQLVLDFNQNPWLFPKGDQIEPAAIGDLSIVAENRPRLIRDATRVISVSHGVNIETLVNRTYTDPNEALMFLSVNGLEQLAAIAYAGPGLSVTRMKLEFPQGIAPHAVVTELKAAYPMWDIRWTQRPLTSPGKAVNQKVVSRN
jgi:hypothetical protein